MTKSILFLLCGAFVYAQEFYAKIEPIEKYQVKSKVSGQVLQSNSTYEGKYVDNQSIIQIDDTLDKINLDTYAKKLELLKESLALSTTQLQNTKEIADTKKEQYEKFNSLATRSQITKNNDFFDYLNANNQYLSTKDKVLTIKTQINDTEYAISNLKDIINNKNITAKNMYVYKVYVKKYDYVSPSTPLLDMYDTSRGKIEVYVPLDIAQNIQSKKIYIDDKQPNYTISKVYKVADTENISSYKIEITIDKPEFFSKLVKVDIK